MKWIKKGKSWIYVNDDDSVFDRVIYENDIYQSSKYCRCYVSLSAMKKYIEYAHAKEFAKVENYVLEEEKADPVLSFQKIAAYALATILFLIIFTMIFSNKAHADAKDIRDMLNTFAPPPQVVFVQPALNPLPPAYLPPVQGNPNLSGDSYNQFNNNVVVPSTQGYDLYGN